MIESTCLTYIYIHIHRYSFAILSTVPVRFKLNSRNTKHHIISGQTNALPDFKKNARLWKTSWGRKNLPNLKGGYTSKSTRDIDQHIPPIYGLYNGCIGQYGVLFGEQLPRVPSQGYPTFPLKISPILQAFYESQLIGRNFWTIKILCDSCMTRNLGVWGRKAVQVANECISPFTQFLNHQHVWRHDMDVQSTFVALPAQRKCQPLSLDTINTMCNQYFETLFTRLPYKDAFLEHSNLRKMLFQKWSAQWYQIILCSSMWWVYYSFGIPSQDEKSFPNQAFQEHSIEPGEMHPLEPRNKKKKHWESPHPMKFWLVKKGGSFAVMYILYHLSKHYNPPIKPTVGFLFVAPNFSHKQPQKGKKKRHVHRDTQQCSVAETLHMLHRQPDL